MHDLTPDDEPRDDDPEVPDELDDDLEDADLDEDVDDDLDAEDDELDAEDPDAEDVVVESVLDPELDRVVYAVSGWSSILQSGITDSLNVAGILFEWDDNGDLVVSVRDEALVDEIFDAMPDPDDPDVVDTEGLDVQEALTAMWTATGSLAKHPDQADAVLTVIETADVMLRMPLPFGFDPPVWRDIMAKCAVLRDALESEDHDAQLTDDELQEGCAELHEQLRHYI